MIKIQRLVFIFTTHHRLKLSPTHTHTIKVVIMNTVVSLIYLVYKFIIEIPMNIYINQYVNLALDFFDLT